MVATVDTHIDFDLDDPMRGSLGVEVVTDRRIGHAADLLSANAGDGGHGEEMGSYSAAVLLDAASNPLARCQEALIGSLLGSER